MTAARRSIDPVQVLIELARTNFGAFVSAVHRPRFVHSAFSAKVCAAVDAFIGDLLAGQRPVLVLTAPPQHGKSSLIARCLPPYLFGRLANELPSVRIASVSYAHSLAQRNKRDAQLIMREPVYRAIFPRTSLIGFTGVDNANDGLQVPGDGWLRGVGTGGGLTGFSVDCGLIDDAVKNAQEALSPVIQERNRDWYDAVFMTRLQRRSGQLIIGTPWSNHDLLAHIQSIHEGSPSYRCLSFPALNNPDEPGWQPDLPPGPLVPHLHDHDKLAEIKRHISPMWWAALYQQTPLAVIGAIFPRDNVQYYRRAELPPPKEQQRVIMTVDATFKGGNSSDYVAVGVWMRDVRERVWLLDYRREQLAFMATARAISDLKHKHPRAGRIYIEQAANGEALIDMLGKHFPQIEGIPPMGTKEARAHAVSWVWTNNSVLLPHPDESPGIRPWVAEITSFPDVRNDDTVDCMTIALQQLCLRSPIANLITRSVLRAATAPTSAPGVTRPGSKNYARRPRGPS